MCGKSERVKTRTGEKEMKTEYLQSFTAVVDSRSFSQAAKRLFLSQPTISAHIKQLEEELRVQLLTRSTKDVQLTDAGLIFYPYALRLLETEKEAMLALHGKAGSLKGTVRIAASTVPANYVLADFIAYMNGKYPEISYKIAEGDSTKVVQEVFHFEAEIGVTGFQIKNPKCIYEELFTGQIVLITPNTPYYAALSGRMSEAELKKLRYIVREKGSGTGLAAQNVEQALGLSEANMNIVAQFDSTEMIKRAVAGGVGSAFIAKLAVMDYVQAGKVLLFEFPDIDTERTFYTVRHCDRALSQAAAATLKELSAFCARIDI